MIESCPTCHRRICREDCPMRPRPIMDLLAESGITADAPAFPVQYMRDLERENSKLLDRVGELEKALEGCINLYDSGTAWPNAIVVARQALRRPGGET
jgi:hypothetical protein